MKYVSLGPCAEWAPPWCAAGKRLERDSRHGLKRLVKRLKLKAYPTSEPNCVRSMARSITCTAAWSSSKSSAYWPSKKHALRCMAGRLPSKKCALLVQSLDPARPVARPCSSSRSTLLVQSLVALLVQSLDPLLQRLVPLMRMLPLAPRKLARSSL